jgi:tetratricopeptide (TPR) repeat protein
MARDDRKRGGHRGSQPPKPEPEPTTEPVDLFSEEDLDAFLQSPAAAAPGAGAEPPPLQEPENDFAQEEGTGEIDLEDIEEAQDIAVFDQQQAAEKDALDFDAGPAVPAAPDPLAPPEPEVAPGHQAVSAFAPPPAPAAYAPPAPAAYAPPAPAAYAPPETAAYAPPETAAYAPPETAAYAPPETAPPPAAQTYTPTAMYGAPHTAAPGYASAPAQPAYPPPAAGPAVGYAPPVAPSPYPPAPHVPPAPAPYAPPPAAHAPPAAAYAPPAAAPAAAHAPAAPHAPARRATARAATPPPLEEYAGGMTERTFLNDHQMFRAEAQRLARGRDWQALSAMTSAALADAQWAQVPEAHAGLLLELACIYRDRLGDRAAAEETFARLAQHDPSNRDAIAFLSDVYSGRGEWRALHDLYANAVEPTWDPNLRLDLTRQAVDIARQQLNDPQLAIAAWEKLQRLDEAPEVVYQELTHAYRGAGRWDALAEYLGERAMRLGGAERVVALREVAEVYLTGLRDQEKAALILEELLEARGDDPIALLSLARVLARRQDWGALELLGARPLDRLPPAVVLDFRRLVADAFWQAERLDQALQAYERVLELDPADKDALRAKEEYLTRTGRHDALLQFFVERADATTDDEVRADFLARAATLAEKQLDSPARAIELWERRIALGQADLQAYRAITDLDESVGDLQGVARGLEGQLALTKAPNERIELLRRLGDHFAHRLGNDDRAEKCWKEILTLNPTDIATREELIALHRRRGNFEALDSAVTRQIWIAPDDEKALALARLAAQNLDENIGDPGRSIDGWFRVLDYAPADIEALQALAKHFEAQKRPRDLIATLEIQLRTAAERDAQIELARRIAGLWEAEDGRLAALGSYERILRWNPVAELALESLVRLCQDGDTGKAQVALEVASGLREEVSARIALLRQALGLLPKDDALGRFFWLSRVLWLGNGDAKTLAEVVKQAEAAKAWPDLAGIHVRLAAGLDGTARLPHLRSLARLCEDKLEDPARAYLALQAVGLQPGGHGEVLPALEKLAQTTGRHEDYLAVLESQAGVAASTPARQLVLRERATICEHKLKNAERAFQEQRRLLDLDPNDQAARKELHRLAEKQGLWRQLDAVYGELWDKLPSVADRIDIARARYEIRRDQLKDPVAALDQLVAIYRLDPLMPGILEEVLKTAGEQGAWARVLPVVEAAQRAAGEAAMPGDLKRTAALYEDKLKDRERAFELYAEAFVLNPVDADLPEVLEGLAESTGRWERLAQTFRLAAARNLAGDQTLGLFRRIAKIYEEKLNAPNRAIDVHRRILGLKPDAIPSLEVMIQWHRKREEWRDLRDRLRQWIEHAPKEQPREGHWVEIARISQQRLRDPEEALAAFAEVLDRDPQNAEAAQGLAGLTADITDPHLELRRMRVDLARAPKEERVGKLLAIATLLEERLEDKDQAIDTLRLLVGETGPSAEGFAPLARLYRETARWADLAQLLEDRADGEAEAAARLARLDEALAVCHQHLLQPPFDRQERLYRKVLKDRAADRDVRNRLARLLRGAGRWADLDDVLRAGIAVSTDAEERFELRRELARVLDLSLGGGAAAETVLKDLLGEQPQAMGALLALAGIVARRKDLPTYLELRQKQAKLLSPQQAALVFCHLAEVCDETPALQPKTVQFYREARTLDPENVPAMEALKAVGRRLKNWRAQAALLPEAGEAQLSWAERSERLKWRGDQVREVEASEAVGWYWRAVAVDPDNSDAWSAIAGLAEYGGDLEGAYVARRNALHAYERRTPPSPERLREHAELIHRTSLAAKAAAHDDVARVLSRRAYELLPEYAPAALSVADERGAAGDSQAAYALYDGALRDPEALSEAEKLHATFQRALLARKLGKHDQAITDLRATLRMRPLHAEALTALAEELAGEGRVAAAIQHHLQSLLVVDEPEHRGRLYRELGFLWEDQLGNVEEAGVCYDLAVSGGVRDRDLMLRALQHYQRTGQTERALAVVEGLIPQTEDPKELASLWVARGETYAARPEMQEAAIEAFDMALSYDPGARAALDGLAHVLEARGDWDQLLQILEARADSASLDERADAMERMARICAERLGEPQRAERYLRQLIDFAPSRSVLEQLLALYGEDPARSADRRVVLGRLCAFGPPWMRRVVDLGRMLLDHAERRWAWCLLSPLVNVSPPPADIKQMLMDLRKEFEKADNIGALAAQVPETVRHPDDDPALTAVLAELGQRVPELGRATPEDLGGGGIARIGETTALGKTFDSIRGLLGAGEGQLFRAQELPEAVMVVNSDPPKAVLRTEFLQLLGNAELAWVFAYALDLMRPGHRVVACHPEREWPHVVAALAAALGFGDPPPAAAGMASVILSRVDDATRADWARRLEHLRETPPEALGQRYAAGMTESARRLGTVAAADLRLVIRVFSRMYEEVPKPKTVGRVEEMDDYLAEVPALQRLLAFAASPEFGAIVSR